MYLVWNSGVELRKARPGWDSTTSYRRRGEGLCERLGEVCEVCSVRKGGDCVRDEVYKDM